MRDLIGTRAARLAPADGYTVLATSPGFTNVPALYDKPPFDPRKDFEPIILMSKAPYVLVVHPKFPATSMGELVSWAKANPGKLNFALSGVGTTIHLAQVWLADATGLEMTTVPSKGTGPATQDLIAGQVHVAFANVISAGPHIKAGRIRPLAETGLFIPEVDAASPEYSAFSTHDFLDALQPLNKYGYAMKKLMERIRDLAILHSSLTSAEGRRNTQRRYEAFLEPKFRSRLAHLIERCQSTHDPDRKLDLKLKIAELTRRITEAKMIWERYAPWDS